MIGDILKKTREELGLDLKETAHTLRIQYEYLKAIESNNLKKLPAEVYTKGYIREYARFLNIDPMPLIDEYTDYLVKQDVAVQPEQLTIKKNFTLPRVLLLVTVIVIIVAVLIIYYPKNKVSMEESKIARIPAPSPVIEESKSSVSNVAPRSSHILNIIATDTTWLRIEYEEGKSEEVLMKPGETKVWTSQNGFNLRLGNAGGVKLVLNNKDMGTPGEKGKVLTLRLP